jgi:hypothetical protein
MEPAPKKRSPWLWVGLGCLSILVVGGCAFAGLAYWGFSKVKDWGEEMADPAMRFNNAKEILGAQELPPGYGSLFAANLFGKVRTAVLSDSVLSDGGAGEDPDRLLTYYQGSVTTDEVRGFVPFFEGKHELVETLAPGHLPLEETQLREVTVRGKLESNGATVGYAIGPGSFQGRFSNTGEEEAQVTSAMIDCPGDAEVRLLGWRTPLPPEGSAGDPAAELGQLLSHFHLCQPK